MVSIESVSVACFCALCECIFVVCGQFLYGGCICAYTMRVHPSVVVGVDGGV